jgi:hypothetical protein
VYCGGTFVTLAKAVAARDRLAAELDGRDRSGS